MAYDPGRLSPMWMAPSKEREERRREEEARKKPKHMFGRRLGLTSEWGITESLCGKQYQDLTVEIHGMGKRPKADLREFSVDAEATCSRCIRVREGRRPGWLKRLWRKLTGYKEWETSEPIRVVEKL